MTESIVIDDVNNTAAKMAALARADISWSLNDYGTGYSNADVLRQFSLSELKIDRTFIARLPGNNADEEVLKGLLAMARALKLKVVVEGVERQAQLEALVGIGFTQFRGFAFAIPMSAKNVEQRLEYEEACKNQLPKLRA